jgi:hypothetical protein
MNGPDAVFILLAYYLATIGITIMLQSFYKAGRWNEFFHLATSVAVKKVKPVNWK